MEREFNDLSIVLEKKCDAHAHLLHAGAPFADDHAQIVIFMGDLHPSTHVSNKNQCKGVDVDCRLLFFLGTFLFGFLS